MEKIRDVNNCWIILSFRKIHGGTLLRIELLQYIYPGLQKVGIGRGGELRRRHYTKCHHL